MKSYKREYWKTKDSWLKARGIGGSEAAAIVGESNWLTSSDIYSKLVLGKEHKIKINERMQKGTEAESHIRELFKLDTDYEIISPPKKSHWLYRRRDYPLITCTPDGFAKTPDGLFGLEVKYVSLITKASREQWESCILPNQYYFQCLHYMVTMDDLTGVILIAHLQYYKHNDETDKWEFDYAIDKPFYIYKEDVMNHLKYLESKEIEFITKYVEKRKRPPLKLKIGDKNE